MTITVLDSTNLQAVLDDAQGIVTEPKVDLRSQEDKNPTDTEAKDVKPDPDPTDPDDVEGDDGLTPRDKREKSASMLKAIGKKHRQLREAEEFAAAQYSERKLAEDQAAKLRQELDSLKAKGAEPVKQAELPQKPNRYSYGTEDEYLEALTDWKVDEKLAAMAVRDAQQAEERRQAQILQTAGERIKRAMELVPDFAEATNIDDDVPPLIANYMQRSDMIAELGYHFAKNPGELKALKSLPNDEQLVQLGEIKGKLTPFGAKPKAATAKTPSTASDETEPVVVPSKARVAAPVIKPLSNAGTSAQEPDESDLNIRESIALWTKKNKANFSVRKRH